MPQNLLKIYDGREHFWQFDTGQKLIVLDRTIDQIHFSNKSMTKAIIKEVYVDDDGVRICDVPDMMLKMPHSLIAYSYVMNDDSNKTICMTKFSVSTRQIPEDYSYEENNRFKDLVDKIESVEDILESGTSIKRFNSLDEANAYVQDYKESGVLLSVWNGEEWALYMVAENYTLEQIGDLDQLILDVEQLQILVGDEPVADQISHAILEQDLPNTYEKLGAADAVRNELRDEVERAKFEETAITRELHKINGNIENLQDDIEDVNSAFDEYKKSNDAAVKEIADDYLKAADKTELEGKITTAQNAADKAQGEVDTLAGVISGKLDASALPTAINTALAQAKASGEFDGKDGVDGKDGQDGYTPVKGVDYFDGEKGDPFTYEDFTAEQLVELKGDKGEKGDKGDQGETGATGATGKDGADGKSAYQYAQDGGFEGTEEEFAAKLAATDSDTELVLSDNLLDKSLLTKGGVWYYGSSGIQLAGNADSYSYYGFIPLRGAGTYHTKFQAKVHESTYKRIALVDDNNNFVTNVTGSHGEIPSDTNDQTRNWLDFEFVVTQANIDAGATKVAFDVYSLYMEQTMIVKDREYPSEYIPYGYIEVTTDKGKKQDNVLCEKTAVFLGDSICAGTTVGTDSPYYNYGWGGIIGEANRMNWTNYGKNGGMITHRGADGTCISKIADTAIAEHPNADYVIFEGGCNDADQMKEAGLGEISADYATFDTTTFSGALESLILKLVTAYPNAKIGYIIPQKMYKGYADFTANNHIHRKYFDRATEICQKWGIPVIDIWNGSMLNPKLSTASVYYSDGIQHLTEAGYLAITPMIEAWMRNMYTAGSIAVAGGTGGGVSSWNDLCESDNAVLLPKTQFAYDSTFGLFAVPGYIDFVVGKTYTVNWNGVDYATEAVPGTFNGESLVMLGNPAALGGANNNLPFAVACLMGSIGAIPLDGSTAVNVGITGYLLTKIPVQYLPRIQYDICINEADIDQSTGQHEMTYDTTELVDVLLAGGSVYLQVKGTVGYLAQRLSLSAATVYWAGVDLPTFEETLSAWVEEKGKAKAPLFMIFAGNAVGGFNLALNIND